MANVIGGMLIRPLAHSEGFPVTHPMKLMALSVVLAAPLLAAETPQAGPASQNSCAHSVVVDTDVFTCPLSAARVATKYRFKANFTGVHDDTMVSLIPLLNEQPLTCAEGSKTRFVGDELGDSSLECRFTLPADAGDKPVLKVRMKWSHAEHDSVELIRE